jgi:nucleotide-binding universal stress UspA family protein
MYNKILVPLDGSPLSEGSLEHVRSIINGNSQTEVILFRIVEPISSFDASALAQSVYLIGDVLGKKTEEAKDYLARLTGKLQGEGLSARGEVVSGQPAEAILNYVDKNNIDLIVMTSHGRTGISRWAFGSVADKVLRQAKIPILLVSAPGRESKA